ncbi:MAG: substrate-binding domain-containing protein [Anaerobutyricum hallii]
MKITSGSGIFTQGGKSGYQKVVNSHLEAAATVNRGEADVAVGSEKHGLSVPGIDFIFHTGRKLRYGNPKRRFH